MVRAMTEVEVAIIGAGPAGLSAVEELLARGARVALVDDNPLPGGQYYRQVPPPIRRSAKTALDAGDERSARLYSVVAHERMIYLPDATVWSVSDSGTLAYTQGINSGRLRARFVVIAAGASDRSVPFPGWTLDSVFTAGGVLNLIKSQRVAPGKRVLVVGNGPLILAVAHDLLAAGVRVVAVAEAAPAGGAFRQLARLAVAPTFLVRGLGYRLKLVRAGVPYFNGYAVVEAFDAGFVCRAAIAPIDEEGRIDRTKRRFFDVDTLVVGYGLVPSVELTRLYGCRHTFIPLRGGWVPVRTRALETTQPGVFAVGDGAGIGGAEIAILEGRIAALEISRRMGTLAPSEVSGPFERALSQLRRLDTFREGLARAFAPPAHYLGLLTPETIVCRCEEIPYETIRKSLEGGDVVLAEVKSATRITMGRCQGRNCLRTLQDAARSRTGRTLEESDLPRARPPARPVRIEDLLHEPLPPPVSPDMQGQ